MKAEHRKELQTNALADRMGRLIQRARQGPSRATVVTVVLVILLVGAVFFFLWRRSSSIQREATRWLDFDLGPYPKYLAGQNQVPVSHYEYLLDQAPGTPQARGAAAQLAWEKLYDRGIKSLLARPLEAVHSIKDAKKEYERLLPDVEKDDVLGPEVRYALAVAEESLAVEDPETHLKRAIRLYKAVVDEHPKSAHAKQATARLKQLKDAEQYHRIEAFYVDLRREYLQAVQRHGFQQDLQEQIRRFQLQQQQQKKK
jgi:hypothetical protein